MLNLTRRIVLNDRHDAPPAPLENLSQAMLSAIRDIIAESTTSSGAIDYRAIKMSGGYERYLDLAANLKRFNPEALGSENERRAFWINLYNTIVIDGIVACNLRSSVKEMRGFFRKVCYRIDSYIFSPDDIEHGILRANRRHPARFFPQFNPLFDPRVHLSLKTVDPRIHCALVCGAKSCPPVKFYSPSHIDAELERAATNFVNSGEAVIEPDKQRIRISRIFAWYARDFGGRNGVLEFIARYCLNDEHRAFLLSNRNRLHIEYQEYNWRLNA